MRSNGQRHEVIAISFLDGRRRNRGMTNAIFDGAYASRGDVRTVVRLTSREAGATKLRTPSSSY
jgi:hypothetical protein